MTLRSQTTAVVLLLIVLGLVFVLVADTGVSTGVFLPDPTLTMTPTIAPTAVPLGEGTAENWTEQTPGQLTYTRDPEILAQIQTVTLPVEEFAQQSGLEMPADDVTYPLVDLLTQVRASLEAEVSAAQLVVDPDKIDGPAIQVLDGVPVTLLRFQIESQTSPDDQVFDGLDYVQALIERADSDLEVVMYVLQGEPDAVAYNDFLAWLTNKAAEVTTPADESETTDAEDAGAADTGEAESADTGETESVDTEEAEPSTDEAEPSADEIEPSADEAPPETEGDDDTAAAVPQEPWIEITQGQVLYIADQNVVAQIQYNVMPLDELAAQVGLEIVPGNQDEQMLGFLEQLRGNFEVQETAQGFDVSDDAFEGPEMREVGGVSLAFLRFTIQPQESDSGEAFAGLDLVTLLIPVDETRVNAVQFVLQGEPNPAVYADFETWLDENAARLAEPPAADADTAAPDAAASEADAAETGADE
ncbi:MAG: hypothetical protein JW966_07015 [Anaerolineae bacterium]|nr:hypothetical protein [Anaerolineae bacterium]